MVQFQLCISWLHMIDQLLVSKIPCQRQGDGCGRCPMHSATHHLRGLHGYLQSFSSAGVLANRCHSSGSSLPPCARTKINIDYCPRYLNPFLPLHHNMSYPERPIRNWLSFVGLASRTRFPPLLGFCSWLPLSHDKLLF